MIGTQSTKVGCIVMNENTVIVYAFKVLRIALINIFKVLLVKLA